MTDASAPRHYVIASSKPWHDGLGQQLRAEFADTWTHVGTPDELLRVASEDPTIRYIFFLHWNWIVPESIWSRFECVCFHMTDVPYGRGGSPLQNLIVRGHRDTQLTALRMVAELDAGPVYTKRPLSLDGRAIEIFERATALSVDILRWMVREEPTSVAQEGTAEIFTRRRPAQSLLPADGTLEQLYDHIRMLDAPTYPAAFLTHGAFRLEFDHAVLDGDEIRASVTIRRAPTSDSP